MINFLTRQKAYVYEYFPFRMKCLLFSCIILFLFPLTLAFSEYSEDVDFLLAEGNSFADLGKYEEAISYYDKVLEIDPNNLNVLGKKGDALVKLDNPEQIISYFEKIVVLGPSQINALETSFLDKVLEIDPNNIDALYYKGKSLAVYYDKLEEANSYLDRVLEIDPNHLDALSKKGDVFFEHDDYETAISYYDRVLEVDPNHVDALSAKGYSLAKLEHFEESNSYLDKALEIDPHNADALYRKGSSLLAQNNGDEALSYFYQALQIDNKHFLAKLKFHLLAKMYNQKPLDGFVEMKVHDSAGNLVAHLRIDELFGLNNEIIDDMIDEWSVRKIINRDGIDYEVRQNVQEIHANNRFMYGGAQFYGIYFPKNDDSPAILLHTSYWQFFVERGDTVTLVQTVFKPVV